MGHASGGGERARVLAAVLAAALLLVLVGVRVLSDGSPQAAGPASAGRGAAVPEQTASPTPVLGPVPRDDEPLSDEALAGIRFVEVTAEAGLAGRGPATPEPTAADMDAGAAVADLDDDGDLDLLLTSSGRASGLYRNDDGVFVDITGRSGIGRPTAATAAAFADVDADGDLDLFLGGPVPAFGRLLLNDGSGRFVDGSARAGVRGRSLDRGEQRAVRGVDFGDVDQDGDLDLVVTDWNVGSPLAVQVAQGDASDRIAGQCQHAQMARRLHAAGSLEVTGDTRAFRNDGGRFTDATRAWGLADLRIERPFTPQLADLDDDGWPDLAVAGDSCTSRLFRNMTGRRFVDVTEQAGVGRDENGMGSVVRDLDGDGRPDWMVTSIAYPTADGSCPQVSLFAGCSGNRVYLNRGRMRFEDVAGDLGLRDTGWGWGVVAADFANDGRVQVAVANGRVGPEAVNTADQADVYYDAFDHDPTAFLVQSEDGRYADAAAEVGIRDDEVAHALVAFDHDRDGRLDLLVANAGAPPHLYRNVTPRRHWLGLRLRDPATPGNVAGIGSRVEVTSTSGATTTQWVQTSGSYEAQHPAELHVGLGDAGVARVRVWWPGQSRPQVLRTPRADRLLTIVRRR